MDDAAPLPAPSLDWALFLDVDGTLLEIVETPEMVAPDGALTATLSALHQHLGGAVALVSGRPLSTLDRLFAPLRLPAAGLHGLERRDAQGRTARPVATPEALDDVRRAFRDFAAAHRGALIEDKGLTVALHFRRIPEAGEAALRLADALIARLDGGLTAQTGKMVVEIRPEGPDKGSVIQAFMAEPPFAGRVPVFIGDDATDEAGFAAVNRLGGHAIRVGGDEPTQARTRIASVKDLLSWLDAVTTVFATDAPLISPGRP